MQEGVPDDASKDERLHFSTWDHMQGQRFLCGEIVIGRMRASRLEEEESRTAQLRSYLQVCPEGFIVMHNCVWRGIVRIVKGIDDGNAGVWRRGTPTTTLEQFGRPVPGVIATIVRAFRSVTTHWINAWRSTPGARVWQHNYWEYIIRNEMALERIRQYMMIDPACWTMRRENLHR